jgi:hypothetical protein
VKWTAHAYSCHMDNSWVLYGIIPIAIAAVMAAVGKQNRKPPEVVNGWITLRQPKFFAYLGWSVMILFGVFAVGSSTMVGNTEWSVIFFIAAVFISMGLMGWILVRDARNCRVIFNDQFIEVTHGNGRTERCSWEEITSGSVHAISKMIHLRTADGRKLKLNADWVGGDALFQMMKRRTALPVDDLLAKARVHG